MDLGPQFVSDVTVVLPVGLSAGTSSAEKSRFRRFTDDLPSVLARALTQTDGQCLDAIQISEKLKKFYQTLTGFFRTGCGPQQIHPGRSSVGPLSMLPQASALMDLGGVMYG